MSVDLKWACAAGALVVTVWSAEHGLPMAATPASSVSQVRRRRRAVHVGRLLELPARGRCTEPIRATAGVGRRGVGAW